MRSETSTRSSSATFPHSLRRRTGLRLVPFRDRLLVHSDRSGQADLVRVSADAEGADAEGADAEGAAASNFSSKTSSRVDAERFQTVAGERE